MAEKLTPRRIASRKHRRAAAKRSRADRQAAPRPTPRVRHHVHLAFDAAWGDTPPATPAQALQEQGRTDHFAVSYDTRLGEAGRVIANYLVQACEYDFNNVSALFGTRPQALPFHVAVVYSAAGAWHPVPCSNSNIYIGALSANPPNPLFLRSLMVSEMIEVFAADPGTAWACDKSTGDGLSRVLADALVPNQKPINFVTAPFWLDSPRVNWVDSTDDSDRNLPSTGCAVLFLNWLHYQLSKLWPDIARAGRATLAETYKVLNADGTDGWNQFHSLLDARYPLGQPSNVTSDNVFPL